jgi:NADH-quinone oxidoreductase subunit G
LKGAAKPTGLVGDLAPTEAAFALKSLIESLGGVVECRTDGAALPAGERAGYAGTAAIEDIDAARNILLIGADPRAEAPVLGARIRKAWLKGARVASIGAPIDLTFEHVHLGSDRAALSDLAGQDHSDKRPGEGEAPGVIVLGQSALTAEDGPEVLATVARMAEDAGARLLILHTAASRVGAMDVDATCAGGIAEALSGDVIYNLGADEVDVPRNADGGPFVIYQGSHGDRGAHRADVILPAAAWTEEQGLFVNTEGRPQLALRASFPPGEAKENWAILRALSAEAGRQLPFDSLAQLRRAMLEAAPVLGEIGEVAETAWTALPEAGTLGRGEFAPTKTDFYLSNPVARASVLMGELAAIAKGRPAEAIAAE